jgi:peptidoglycan/xylan/chitin deacetylase (PgdA/CDA1 family)
MTMRVTMTVGRRSEDGLSPMLVGSTYTVGDDYGKQLVQIGAAVDTDGVIAATVVAQRDDLLASEARTTRSLVSGAGKTAAQCVRSGRSAVGWSLANSGGATATMAVTATGSPFGFPALKVTIPNDTGSVDVIADGLGLAAFTAGRGNLVWHVYVEDELGIKQWQVHAGNDVSLTRNMTNTYNLSNNNLNRANGHHIGSLNIAGALSNTLLTTDTVDRVRLRFFGQPAGGVVWIEGVYVPEPVTPWMILTIDDSDLSMWTRFRPELNARRLHATFAVDWTNVGTNPALFVSQAQLQTLYDEGHDLSSHNQTNTAYPDENPPTAQPNDAARLTYCTEYRFTRNLMRDLGWTRALGYHPFVQGAHDGALVDSLRGHGMVVGRTTGPGHIEPFRVAQQALIRQRQLGNGFNLATARTWVDAALTHRQDVALMCHVLADTASSSITWAQSDFAALLDYAAGQGMRVGSVSEWGATRGLYV